MLKFVSSFPATQSPTRYFALCSTALALALVGPAFAQESTQHLGQIMIGGDLIAQPGLTTGTSFDVLDQSDLETRPGTASTQDVFERSVNATLATGTAKAPTVRGVDGTGPAENANAFFAGSRPRLSLSVDGRTASFNELAYGNLSLWDVERVELLRGPQSTIVGRNAVGGALLVKTRDPEFQTERKIQLSYGDHDHRRISGVFNAPISDAVALRLSGDWLRKSSPVDYDPYPGVDDPGDIETVNLRAKLLANLDIADGATLLLTAAHSRHKAPHTQIAVRPFEARRSNYPKQAVHEETTNSLGAQFSVDLNPSLTFELNASYADTGFDRKTVPNNSNGEVNGTEVSLDPRLRFTRSDGFEAMIGAHYAHSDQDEFIQFIADQNFKDTRKTFAIYGEAVVPLSQTLELSVGARYEVENHTRKGGDATGAIVAIDIDRDYEVFLPRLRLSWSPEDSQAYGMLISKGYNAGGGGIATGSPNPFPIIHYVYDTETALNAELFGRQELQAGRVRLTQNLFYTRYSDMQLPFDLTPNDTRDELFVVRNADEVVTYGLEIGATYEATPELTVFGSLGLLKTEITSFPGSGVEGNELFMAPARTAKMGFDWVSGDWSTGMTARYCSSYFTDINNRAGGKTDGQVVADARVSYDFGRLSAFAEVNNLFDNDTAVALYPGATRSSDTAVLNQPRELRIGLTTRF